MTESKTPSQRQPGRPTDAESPVFELLEARVLYSADALGVGSVVLPDLTDSNAHDYVSVESAAAPNAGSSAERFVETVFIDSRVPDSDSFINAWASPNTQFVLVETTDDALQLISERLSASADSGVTVASVRIVSHGGDGYIQLGSTNIDEKSLLDNAVLVNQWADALADDADILLYGCNVAQSSIGLSFVETLAQLTSADIAASDDTTGSLQKNGDWELEVSYGVTRDISVVDSQRMADWTHALDIIEVFNDADDAPTDPDMTIARLKAEYAPDQIQLRQAIFAANNTPGDDTIVLVADTNFVGDIQLRASISVNNDTASGNLVLINDTQHDVTIRGSGDASSRLFAVKYNAFTITGDSVGDGQQIILKDGRGKSGGAIQVEHNASLSVSHTLFTGNSSNIFDPGNSGGAIWSAGALNIYHSEFTDNQARRGGAIRVTADATELFINDSTFVSNHAEQSGGAVVTDIGATIHDSSFVNNSVPQSTGPGAALPLVGGAIQSDGMLSITDSHFEGNSSLSGAAIHTEQDVNLTNTTLVNQTSGGAVYTRGTATVADSLFQNNEQSGSDLGGGAILAEGSVFVENSRFIQNTAEGRGGAIVSYQYAQINSSHFLENESLIHTDSITGAKTAGQGGAVFAYKGGLITNSSFVGNKAIVGSAVYTQGEDFTDIAGNPLHVLSVDNVTFSDNEAVANTLPEQASFGTLVLAEHGGLKVTSSTFASNVSASVTAGVLAEPGLVATIGSSLFYDNVVTNSGAHGNTSGVTSTGQNVSDAALTISGPVSAYDAIDQNLVLGALLTQSGGYVQARPPLAGSSAINAGSSENNQSDAFGQPVDDLPDAGAFEFQAPSDTLYWADNDGKIWRSSGSFTNAALVVDTGHNVSGLVIDEDGHNNNGAGRIIWVDRNTGDVHSTLLDGTALGVNGLPRINTQFISEGVPLTVNSLTFDTDRDFLYGTHLGAGDLRPGIRVFEIDDSGSTFVRDIQAAGDGSMVAPGDIHYSAAHGRLYWVDGPAGSPLSTIHSSNIDGTAHAIVYSGTSGEDIRGVTTDDNGASLFFTDQASRTLYELDLSTGTVVNTVSLANGPGSNTISDITYLSNKDEIIVANTFDTFATGTSTSAASVVIASASTTDSLEPSFFIENYHYTEGAPAQAIDANNILVNDPSGSANISFRLVSGPTLGGGELNGPNGPLIPGSTFTLDQGISYYNEEIVNETSDVFQLQMLIDGFAVGPVQAFVVNTYPVDDPAEFDIADVSVDENGSLVLKASGFMLVDEEISYPDSYRVISPIQANNNLLLEVDGVSTNEFTHDDLLNGRVVINAENTIITSSGSSAPVNNALEIQALLDGVPIPLGNSNQSTIMTVEIVPMDDAPELSARQTSMDIEEGLPGTAIMDDLFVYNDEENDAPAALVLQSSTLTPDIVLEVNGAAHSGPVSWADLAAGNFTISAENAVIADQLPRSYTLHFYALDENNVASNPVELTINVTPNNDPPSIHPMNLIVSEHSTVPLSTGTFNLQDEETPIGAVFELSPSKLFVDTEFLLNGQPIVPGDGGVIVFTQEQLDNGEIEFSALNAEFIGGGSTTLSFGVEAVLSDGTRTALEQFDILVNHVNAPPILDFAAGSVTLFENSAVSIPGNLFVVNDPESETPVAYSVDSSLDGLPFAITVNGTALEQGQTFSHNDLVAGLLSVDATNADLTSALTHDVFFTALMPTAPHSDSEAIAITVNPVNDAATLAPVHVTAVEGDVIVLNASHFNFNDEETPNDGAAEFVLATNDDLHGAFLVIAGQPSAPNVSFTFAQLISGDVVFDSRAADVPPGQQLVINFASIVRPVTGPASGANPFIVTLHAANDPALLSFPDGGITVDENESANIQPTLFVVDDEEGARPVDYVVGNDLADKPYRLTLLGDATTLTQGSRFSHQDLLNGNVVIDATDANLSSTLSDSITLTANLADGTTTFAAALPVTLNPVNDAPVLSPVPVSLEEGDEIVLNAQYFNFDDEETPADGATIFNLSTSDNTHGATLVIDGQATGPVSSFTYSQLINGEVSFDTGSANIPEGQTLLLTFDAIAQPSTGPASNTAPMIIAINPVNEAPVLAPVTLVMNEGSVTQLNAATFGFDDEESSDTRYVVNTIANHNGTQLMLNGEALSQGAIIEHRDLLNGQVFVNAENTLNAGNVPQQVTFSLTAVPDTGPASSTEDFVVVVNPVNDRPLATPQSQIMTENDVLVLDAAMFGYSDEENDTLSHLVVDAFTPLPGVVLTVDGVAVQDGDTVSVTQLDQGRVVLNATAADVGLGDTVSLAFQAVSDNALTSDSRVLSVTLLPEDDAAILVAQTDAVEVTEGTVVTLGPEQFTLTDEENASVTEYVVLSLPTEPGVRVERNGVPFQTNERFSQQDLIDGRITITATGAPLLQSALDALNVYAELDDGSRTNATDLLLVFNPVEDTPQLHTSAIISAAEDRATTIRPEQFLFTDADGDTLVEYRLSTALSTDGFTLERDGVPLSPGDTFTHSDLVQGLITVQSDGTNINTTHVDAFRVIAVSSNGLESNEANVTVLLQPNNDAPVLSIGTDIVANENALSPVTPEHLVVSDAENDPASAFTLISPMNADIGTIAVAGQTLNANDTFTAEELAAGDVQIDLQALDITEDAVASFSLAVTAGGQTSAPLTLAVQVNEVNDDPQFALSEPLSLPPLVPGTPVAIPDNAFTDSDGDLISYSALVADEPSGGTEPLPEWLVFDASSGVFELVGRPTTDRLDVLLIASDLNEGEAQETIRLRFNEPPQLASATPASAPVELAAVESPTTTSAATTAPRPVPGAPTESVTEETAATESTASDSSETDAPADQIADEMSLTTSDIESSRIDLATLLPSLKAMSNAQVNANLDHQSTDQILSELLGFTNSIARTDPFQISTVESQHYQARLDDLAERWDDAAELPDTLLQNFDTAVGTSVGLSSGFTAGYMLWLLRGGTLMGSVLSSLPAWRLVDPLPVLAELDNDLDDDNESLESMVSRTKDEPLGTEAADAPAAN